MNEPDVPRSTHWIGFEVLLTSQLLEMIQEHMTKHGDTVVECEGPTEIFTPTHAEAWVMAGNGKEYTVFTLTCLEDEDD